MTDTTQTQLDALNAERAGRMASAMATYRTNDVCYGVRVAQRQYDQQTADIQRWYDAELRRIQDKAE